MIFLRKGKFTLFLYLFLITNCLLAQIDLSMPVNRMVYQRSKANIATIYVGGSFSGQLDRIEARLTTLDGTGNPKTPLNQTEWAVVINKPTKGSFLGSMPNIKGGWYRLEVRAIQNNEQLGDISTIKVGVGEVFVIAGQSNAMGEVPVKDRTMFGAKDDRVNCVNKIDLSLTNPLAYPEISHMEPYSFIAPTGQSSWVWGPMGDLVTKNWDVPVIFFNAAIGGSYIAAWRAGALNENVPSIFNLFDHSKGEPFIHLKRSLNYYSALMGIRAVLWAQGETDSGIFEAGDGLSPEIYKSNLQQVIQQSRNISDKDISWVIAKSSKTEFIVSPRVLQGQQLTVDIPNFNTFLGPNTDLIQPTNEERDFFGVHFVGQGLVQVGTAWFNSINTPNFLNNSKPQLAGIPESLNLGACVNDNQITVQMPSGFSEYTWYSDNYNQKTQSQSFTAINAKYLVPYMKDASGKNYVFSPPLNFNPAKLNITTDRSTNLCDGQTVNIIANTFNNNYNWDNGKTSKIIPIKEAGPISLSVSSQDVYGCVAKATANYTVKVNSLPPTPKIISESSPSICEGTSVVLKPENAIADIETIWSNNATDANISVKTKGSYFLKYKDKNNCESAPSNTIDVVVNPNPGKPDIVAGGATTFCADKFVTVATTSSTSYEWYRDNILEPTHKTQNVNLSLPGTYQAKVLNSFGCPSPFSNELKINTWALPDSPIISKNGPTVFCSGQSLELLASSSLSSIVWKTDNGIISNADKISINSQADSKVNVNTTYFATVTDDRGCQSPPSEKVLVAIRANPSTPRIERAGTFTLEAKAPILGLDGAAYDWYLKDQLLPSKQSTIKVNTPGNYFVKAKINYTIPNGDKLECVSGVAQVYDYFEEPTNVFSFFPNPSRDGKIILETRENLTNVQILVFTPIGQIIRQLNVDIFDKGKQLVLSDLPAGNFKIRMKAGNLSVTKNLVIVR